MNEAELATLLDATFSGPGRAVEHWENWLLTDCTRRDPMPDGLLHPVILFHLPIQAASTSIGELFALAGSDGSPGAVGLLGYDWEYFTPLKEQVVYSGAGSIVKAERHHVTSAGVPVESSQAPDATYDEVSFSIGLTDPDDNLVARITNHWRFNRGPRVKLAGTKSLVGSGRPIPELEVLDISVDRMKTMAALLRDPYEIHWDPETVDSMGLGKRTINQGPLNLSYVANMLMAHAGPGCIRRLTINFHGIVFSGDSVVAGGTVDEDIVVDGEQRQRCTIWLDGGGRRLLSGTAEIVPSL